MPSNPMNPNGLQNYHILPSTKMSTKVTFEPGKHSFPGFFVVFSQGIFQRQGCHTPLTEVEKR